MTMTTERCWHFAIQGQAAGPFIWSEVEAKIASGELDGATLSWKSGEPGWVALGTRDEAKEILARHCKWFIVKNGTQFGPITRSELLTMIEAGQVVHSTLLWSEGMTAWKAASEIPAFAGLVKAPAIPAIPAIPAVASKTAAPPAIQAVGETVGKKEHRGASRRAVHARLIVSNDKTVNVASCHDMSEGGMQVLCDEIPGPVGARIKMNVSPEGSADSFVAKGVIVRIREDRRGYSFRFDELSEGAKRAIANVCRAG